jgi:hypothetical protein
MAERMHYPVGRAAALEARGVASDDPAAGAELLAEAEEAWRALDRPLEATRARLLAGQVLLGHDDERARTLLEEAAAQSESLGVPHLAEKARAAAEDGRLRQR